MTEAEKAISDLELAWFGLACEYPSSHPYRQGSRYGMMEFKLNEPGILDRFAKEFDLQEADIHIWEFRREYNK